MCVYIQYTHLKCMTVEQQCVYIHNILDTKYNNNNLWFNWSRLTLNWKSTAYLTYGNILMIGSYKLHVEFDLQLENNYVKIEKNLLSV